MPKPLAPKPPPGPHEKALSKMAPQARKRYKARQLAEYEWPDAWDISEGSLVVDQVKLEGERLWVFLSSSDFPCDPDGYYFVNPPLKVPDGTWRDEKVNGETVEVENTVEDVEQAFIQIVSEAATYYATHPEVHGRTTLTVYSSTADGDIESTSATYSTARAGTGTLTAYDFAIGSCGQAFFTPDYYIYESFLDFDTSTIPDTATVDSAILSLYSYESPGVRSTDPILEVRLHPWYPTLTTGDWVAGASLGSSTLLATFDVSGWSDGAYQAFADVAFPANVNKTGTTGIVVHSDRQRTNDTPSGDETVVIYEADETGTTKDPKLVINYTEVLDTELVVQDSSHAHTAENLALTQLHSLVVANAEHNHTADNIALTQAHSLVVADASHVHTVDNLVIEEEDTDTELVIQDAVHVHTAETVSLSGSSRISVKFPATLPKIVHEIASPHGDDHPLVEGWECHEVAPGGYESWSGTVDAQRVLNRPDIYAFGAHVRLYDESTGECIWAGRLLDPAINGGTAQLSARGWGVIPDREAGRLLYQTYSLEDWKEHPGLGSFGSDEIKWRLSKQEGILVFNRERNLSGRDQYGARWNFVAPDTGDVHRLRFTLADSNASTRNVAEVVINDLVTDTIDAHTTGTDYDEDANYAGRSAASINVRDADWTELPHVELATSAAADDIIDTVTDHGFSAGDRVRFTSLTGGSGLHEDTFYWVLATSLGARTFKVSRFHATGSAANFTTDITAGRVKLLAPYAPSLQVNCSNVVVNGIAPGDDFSATQLTKDICGRLGIDDGLVQDTGYNVLPLDHQEGPFSEVLDYAAMLVDWRWVVHDNGKGGGPVMDFGPWETRRWTLTDEHAPVDLIPTERWNKLTVTYRDVEHKRPVPITVNADPDPLLVTNNYGRIGLGQAFPSDERPRQIAETLLDHLSKFRPGGTFEASEVMDETGRKRAAFHIRAGDVLDIPWRNQYGLRIKEVRKTASGVTGTFDEGFAALDTLNARKQRRLASR